MSEKDPSGKDQHQAGAKLDAGKNRLGLVLGGFANALQEVGKVGTFGANKYTDDGWLSVENGQARYTDAMLRHHFKEAAGELHDSDSELLHKAHRAWNALADLELYLLGQARPHEITLTLNAKIDPADLTIFSSKAKEIMVSIDPKSIEPAKEDFWR